MKQVNICKIDMYINIFMVEIKKQHFFGNTHLKLVEERRPFLELVVEPASAVKKSSVNRKR